MGTDRTVRVVRVQTPDGRFWATRFVSRDTAWRRVLATLKLADNASARTRLTRAGWRITQETAGETVA